MLEEVMKREPGHGLEGKWVRGRKRQRDGWRKSLEMKEGRVNHICQWTFNPGEWIKRYWCKIKR